MVARGTRMKEAPSKLLYFEGWKNYQHLLFRLSKTKCEYHTECTHFISGPSPYFGFEVVAG